MAYLKFPLMDEDNDQHFFPKLSNELLVKNSVYAKISEPEIENISKYPEAVAERYYDYIKTRKGKFAQWYVKNEEHSDTVFYDMQGKPISYTYRNIMSTNWKFTSDSLGFLSEMLGGSCVHSDTKFFYSFDGKGLTLFQFKLLASDRVRQKSTDDIYCLAAGPDAVYKFDSSGYLMQMICYHPHSADDSYQRPVFMSISNFIYAAGHKIDTISQNLFTQYGIDHAITRYYYDGLRIDSVVTSSSFMKHLDMNCVRTTYYNGEELPVKTKFVNSSSLFSSKAVIYKYLRY